MKKRKDGLWQKSITLPNGKRKVFYSHEKTEHKAELDIRKQLICFNDIEERGKTFEQVADEWEDSHYKNIEYTTQIRYECYVKKAENYFGKTYIKDITPLIIEQFIESLARQNYSTKTIKDQLSVVKMIFKFAVIKGYVSKDVSQYVVPQKGKKSVKRQPLNDDEIDIVKQYADTESGFLPFFLLYSGLRRGEALALQWSDIDLKNSIIHITKSVYFIGNTPHIKAPKTDAGMRDVILLDCVKSKLKKGHKSDYVFSSNNKIMNKSAFTRSWKKWQKDTGLNVTAHQMRHTFATILFEANINVKDTQTILGHSDISVTQNIYTHIRESHAKNTAIKLNEYLRES